MLQSMVSQRIGHNRVSEQQSQQSQSIPAIPFLGIYLEKIVIPKDTCTPVFIAALFTIARTWKQPKCLPTEEWIKKLWYIYTMEYYSAVKWSKLVPSEETWMDPETVMRVK